jgi:FkbM family methyltransferase
VDIGANLGAHTLALSLLAHAGTVIAFEAGSDNFRHLTENVSRVPEPHGEIVCVNRALWDRETLLDFDEVDEFAGCSRVANGDGESYLRRVIPSEVLDGIDLHLRRRRVQAVRFDDWVEEGHLSRIDLVKLDVEGAEARVLAGATDTLARFRPLLLTEYHPGTAEAFGLAPDEYFRLLQQHYADISAVEQDGSLSPVSDWPSLRKRLNDGKGWEDLVCGRTRRSNHDSRAR